MPATALVQESDNADVQEAFKVAEEHFGHVPALVRAMGANPAMCRTITAFFAQSLKEGRVSWAFKELVILKTLRAIGAYYSYGAHEALAIELGNSAEKVGDLANSLWRSSPHYSDGERVVLELVEQIGVDANDVSDELWERLRDHWDAGQLIELNAVITTFVMIGRVGDTLGVSEPVLFKRAVA
jgi:alkylhydroperoxidase family enzyme